MQGWATAGDGTTGGAGGERVTVSTPGDLVDYMAREEPYIIQVEGTIDVTNRDFPGAKSNSRYEITSNKSIVGIGDDARIHGAELRLRNQVSNVIIRNLTLSDSYDTAIAISDGASHVWVDHCDIYGAPDGLIDITTGADFITVSWNRLRGAERMGLSGRNNDGNTDEGKINVTYHHNWFEDLHIRVPYAAWGKFHVFNNYYTNISGYGIGIAAGSRILSEHNYFDGAHRSYFVRDGDGPVWDANPGTMEDEGTIYKNVTNTDGNIPDIPLGWHPKNKYTYELDGASDVPDIVKNGAGVGVVVVGYPLD